MPSPNLHRDPAVAILLPPMLPRRYLLSPLPSRLLRLNQILDAPEIAVPGSFYPLPPLLAAQ